MLKRKKVIVKNIVKSQGNVKLLKTNVSKRLKENMYGLLVISTKVFSKRSNGRQRFDSMEKNKGCI